MEIKPLLFYGFVTTAGNRLSWPAVNAAEFHNFLMVSKYPLQPWFSVMKSPC